ncbi:MAG: IPExxxVDY family protein [Crocinitomicaceae bacterium]|nr:IPExxxVDY family protein [Crocinitomicaceae bacterium]
MAKQKKHTLTFEQMFNFDMIGVCSHHSDYRLAWSINQQLEIQLAKCDEDYFVTNRKGEVISQHSMYEYQDLENRMDYFMVKNKQQGKFLVPEKPTMDYFIFLCDNCAIDINELIKNLRAVPSVLGVYKFDPEEIASAENLVFN